MFKELPVIDHPSQATPTFSSEEADKVATLFKVLSDPVRVRLLHHIWSNCCSSVCVCHMPDQFGISQPTLSYHLGRLAKAGLVSREARGKWAHYRATPDGLATVRRYLDNLPEPKGCGPTC